MKDAAYLRWIRERPCIFEGQECAGCIHAHHATGGGMGMKTSDRETMPLCAKHHAQRHDGTGVFFRLTKAERKQWEADMVANYQALYGADHTEGF